MGDGWGQNNLKTTLGCGSTTPNGGCIESIPAPRKSRDDQELNRFTILRGEILDGNDSKELVKEFKVLLLKMMNEGKIGKSAGREVLMDLISLGY